MNPLVSVVIPTYNHAHFLGRALQSVLDQTYPHWEALVVDNHSQDNTDEVVNSLADPRIRLLKIHNHGIIAASRNLGMQEAKGEWIAFLDSDDCWYARKLEIVMASIASDDSYDVVSTDEYMVDVTTGDKQVLRYGPYQDNFYRALLVEGNRLSPSATVVRHAFLRRHQISFAESQEFVTVEDYGFWLDLARCGARFKFIHDVQGEYVIHGDNSSARLSKHWKNCEALLRNHVFAVQDFHPAPDRLWKLVSPRLRFVQVKQLAGAGRIWAALGSALKVFLSSPGGTSMYLLSKGKRYFKGSEA